MDITVYGMSCERCENKVSTALEAVPGVKVVGVHRSP
jgi:copper chaperone CopZ